jgi:hypothetical protein
MTKVDGKRVYSAKWLEAREKRRARRLKEGKHREWERKIAMQRRFIDAETDEKNRGHQKVTTKIKRMDRKAKRDMAKVAKAAEKK